MSNAAEILNRALSEETPEALAAATPEITSQPSFVNAMSSVLNYIISDAFSLSTEESMWVGYHLNNLLSPLENMLPSAVLGAVRQEIRTGEYSRRMFNRNTTGEIVQPVDGVMYASIEDWVDALSEIVLSCYPSLRPMIKSAIIGSLHGLLTELGLTSNPKRSRGSLYLPTAVRYRLKSNR